VTFDVPQTTTTPQTIIGRNCLRFGCRDTVTLTRLFLSMRETDHLSVIVMMTMMVLVASLI
jgi:hypothetical protein